MSKSMGGVRFSGNPVSGAMVATHDAITRSSVQLHDLKAGSNDGSKARREPQFRCGVLNRECAKPLPWKFTRMKSRCRSKGS